MNKGICAKRMNRHLTALILTGLFLLAPLTGCFGEDEIISTPVEESAYLQPWERADMTYVDTDIFSRVTENGSYETDTVRSVFVDVPTSCLRNSTGIPGNFPRKSWGVRQDFLGVFPRHVTSMVGKGCFQQKRH